MDNKNLAAFAMMLKQVIGDYVENAVNTAEESHQRQLLQLERQRKEEIEALRPPLELAMFTQFSQKIVETKVECKMMRRPQTKKQLICLNNLQKKLSKELKEFDVKVSAPVLPLHHRDPNGDDDDEEEEDLSEEDRNHHDDEATDDEIDDSDSEDDDDDDGDEDNEIDNDNEEGTDSLCSQEKTD
jgi:hypothetical protein